MPNSRVKKIRVADLAAEEMRVCMNDELVSITQNIKSLSHWTTPSSQYFLEGMVPLTG